MDRTSSRHPAPALGSTTKSRLAPPSASACWTVANSMHHPCRLCGRAPWQQCFGATSWDSLRVGATGMMPIAVSCLRIGRAFHHQARDFKLTNCLATALVEGEVTERQHGRLQGSRMGSNFYAATGRRPTALDSIATWAAHRQQFQAGGYGPASCRFYGESQRRAEHPLSPAPATPSATGSKGVGFLAGEGQTPGQQATAFCPPAHPQAQPGCLAGSKPLYLASTTTPAHRAKLRPNHRYVTSRATVDVAVAIGWPDEG